MSLSFDENNTLEGEARQLARHYPTGQIWARKFESGSNLGKLIKAAAGEWLRAKQLTKHIIDELDINKTTDLIEDWEESVGIPDGCFLGVGDIVERRLHVLLKLVDFYGAQTDQDFIDIAALLGFTITIKRVGTGFIFPLPFPLNFFNGTGTNARHTVFIELPISSIVFPLAFPLNFAASSATILQCVFRQLFPANTDIIFLTV